MKIVKLSDQERAFINEYCSSKTLLKTLNTAHCDSKSSSFILAVNHQDLQLICDELSNILTEIGLSEEGEINSIGIKIDTLIDKFNHYT